MLTNIFGQNDAGESGGLSGERLNYGSAGAPSAEVLVCSLDACHFRSGGRPETWRDDRDNYGSHILS